MLLLPVLIIKQNIPNVSITQTGDQIQPQGRRVHSRPGLKRHLTQPQTFISDAAADEKARILTDPGRNVTSLQKQLSLYLLCVDLHIVEVIRIREKEYDRIRITRLLDLIDIEVQEQVTLLNGIAFSNCR